MIELRIHGRGGQGGVTLAKLIATSRFLKGMSVQAFGLYAAERSGAPIQAFCRFAEEPITNRNLIYAPDHVVVLDPTLIGPAVTTGLKPGGWILLNAPAAPESFAEAYPANPIATVDATRLARENKLGTRSVPIVNTALAGAAARVLGFPLEEMLAALDHLGFGGGNVAAARSAYDAVRLFEPEFAEQPEAESPVAPPPTGPGHSLLSGAGADMPLLKTGQWATEQPKRQQMIPPCNQFCPAGNNVQGFMDALAKDRVDEALEILLETTPFPSVCGRACPAPCMNSCNRIELDGAVNVRQMERYAADHGHVVLKRPEQRGEHVAVVGSGPAGLTAAYHLARLGYGVTVHETGPEPGGLLISGIPEFRLPEDIVRGEIDRVLGLGVEVITDHPIDRAGLLALGRTHDAVLVATGLQELRELRLGIADEAAVEQGVPFLDQVHAGTANVDGEDIIVVGGGNTAMDAARSALRLGARSVRVVYRRTREEMPAIGEEIDEAIEEGVIIDYLTQPVALSEDAEAPWHYQLTCKRMRLGPPDESGRRRPEEIPGSEIVRGCDRVILALGQSPDLSVFPEGTEVREGERLLGLLETPVFAVGDLANAEGTIAAAIGSGRRAALQVHAALSGEVIETSRHATAKRVVDEFVDEVIEASSLKLHLFERSAPEEEHHLDPTRRRSTFDEVHIGLEDTAEAKRCLSCGVCNECDRCSTYCPEGVLKRVGHEIQFDYDYCKGCGVCVAECPRNVLVLSHL